MTTNFLFENYSMNTMMAEDANTPILRHLHEKRKSRRMAGAGRHTMSRESNEQFLRMLGGR